MLAPLSPVLTATLPWFTHANNAQRLNILTYHRVLAQPDAFRAAEPTADVFDWQMRLLATHFTPLSLADALAHLDAGTLPKRAVCVTFDDGYADNLSVALPILKQWKIPATVFVSTDFLNGGRMWNDTVIESVRRFEGDQLDLREYDLPVLDMRNYQAKRTALREIIIAIKHRPQIQRSAAVDALAAQVNDLPNDLMMSDQQVQQMSEAGVEIGAHTLSHPILTTLDDATLEREITGSRAYLQNLLNKPIRYFAYPNGKRGPDYDQRERDLVKRLGFAATLSTNWAVAHPGSDRWQLPRFTPWDKDPLKFHLRLLLNYRNPG